MRPASWLATVDDVASQRPALALVQDERRDADDDARALPRRPRLKLTLLRRHAPRAELDGRRLQVSRVRMELLAILAAHPHGLTSEELAAAMYGDTGRPGAVRVQVFRLRKMLGPWVESGPYRLTLNLECDVARVVRLLEAGHVRAAAESYEGPLLPHSEAPGIVRARDMLEGWLRQAVMTAEDTEALWRWVQSTSGHDDLAAWKRLLANVDYRDPRRSLAASRVRALRTAYGLTNLSLARA
jgi:hypothetical protein